MLLLDIGGGGGFAQHRQPSTRTENVNNEGLYAPMMWEGGYRGAGGGQWVYAVKCLGRE